MDAEKPSTSKKRLRKILPKKDDPDSSAEEEKPRSAKKRKTGKPTKPPVVEDEDKATRTVKAKRKLEQILKEAEESEEKSKEAEAEEVEEEKNEVARTPWKMDIHTKNDLVTIVLDEISLEGLDGITLEGLWLRLSVVMSTSPSDVSYRNTFWDIITKSDQLYFYELPEARGNLVVFNRFEHVDVISGHLLDSDDIPQEIYPYSPLRDEKADELKLYGSCATFDSRIDITNKVRNLSLNQAENMGNKLVVVANQYLRNEALGLNDTKFLRKLFNQQYCLLERIGRSRRLGEASSGSTSLRQFGDSKLMFYLRKVLISNDLITKQQICFKNKKAPGNTSALLFHLKRFYFHYKTKKVVIIEQIADMLKKKPNYMMEYAELKKVFGLDVWHNTVIKLLKSSELKLVINTNIIVAYRDIYPNAPKDEWMAKNKKEKPLRVMQLIDPNVNVANSLKELIREELQREESSDDEPLCESVVNKSVYDQAYNVIYKSGTEGLTQSQVCLKLGLDVYVSRIVLKTLERDNFIYFTHADIGSLRVLKYIATNYQKRSKTQTIKIQEEPEDEETLDFISSVLEVDKKYLKQSSQPSQSSQPPQPPKNPLETTTLTGQYKFIKEHRKQCRQEKYNTRFMGEFYDITKNIEDDRRKMDEILRNNHNFFDLKESVSAGIIKKINVSSPDISFKPEKLDGFNLFESYELPETKQAIDYNSMQSQLKNFFNNNNTRIRNVFIEKPDNSNATKILIDYFKTNANISTTQLKEKFDDLMNLLLENEHPKELDDDNEEPSSSSDQISLIQMVENEEFPPPEIPDDVNDFKRDLINNFEVTNNLAPEPIQIIKPDLDNETLKKHTSLNNIFLEDEPLKEFNRNHFNELTEEFKVEIFYGENILVNYVPLDKDLIETVVIFSKNKNVSIELGTKYLSRTMSQRRLDRINYIMDIMYKDKVVSEFFRILNSLKKDELERGLVGVIDKKSFNRLIEVLVDDGYLMAIKVVLRHKDSTKIKHILALPNSDYHPILNAIKEQMKISFFVYSKRKRIEEKTPKEEENDISSKILEIEVDIGGTPKFKYNKFIGKYYGYLPKNSRHRMLHELLFYLLYGYNGSLIETNDLPLYMKQTNFDDYPLYKKEISWKMFIPPPPEYKHYPPGWILYCDVLLRIPICVFVKIYNVTYVIPELVHILNDPIKKHLLLRHIPAKIRNAIFFKRRYIFSIYENLQHLCYLGLLQFGEQKMWMKDQQFLYLNSRAIVYDTTSSNPGYHQTTQKEYPKLSFEFRTEEDVENYWTKVWNICIKTRLGSRYSMLNQTITLQNLFSVPEMIEACKPRSSEKVVANDVGYIPGDGRGACGFDSNSWMFVKRNWVGKAVLKDSIKYDARPIGVRKKQLDKIKTKPVKIKDLQNEFLKKKRKRNGGESNTQGMEQIKPCVPKSKKINKNKPFTRKIHPRPEIKRNIRIDELDKSIRKAGLLTRSKFSPNEDELLTIVNYGIKYLFPTFKRRLISSIVIRDLMHRLCPKACKKTSSAYALRMRKYCRYMNRPDVDTNAVSLEADHFVQKHFSKFRERILDAETIPQDHLHIALIYLVAYCVDSFEKHGTNKKILDEVGYTDYLEEEAYKFKSEMDVKNSLYHDPTSKEDILIDTIKAIIHSSIGFQVEKTMKILHEYLDKIYQTYTEELLRKSVLNLREYNLIKTSIVQGRKHKKLIPANLLQSSYMYSYKQVTKFHQKVYPEAYSVFNCLKNSETTKKFDIATYQEGFGLGLSEIRAVSNLSVLIDIPDKQFILDPNIQNHDYLIKELNARYKRLMSKKTNEQEIISDSKDNQDKSEILDNTLKDLEELSRCIKDGDFNRINTKMSDLAFLLTKGFFPELEDEDDRLEKLSRHFLTMLPDAGFKVERFEGGINGGVSMETVKEVIYKESILNAVQMSRVKIEESLIEIGANLYDVEVAFRLVTFIESKDILGSTAEELKGNLNDHGFLELEIIIDHLIKIGVILKLGVKVFRFVHHSFKDAWTVDCQGKEEKKLKPVPWLHVNGEVNDKVLMDWLLTFQSYCISNPVATFPSLCKRFNFLKPVDVFALLEYLQLLGCLKLKCYENIREPGVFSELLEVTSRSVNCLDNLDDVFIETNNSAVIKLGAVISSSCSEEVLASPFEEWV